MKVLHLVQQPQRRGAEMFAFDLTSELLLRGFDVRTVYLYPAKDNALDLRENDILINADPTHPLERALGFQPKVLNRLRCIVRDFKPDVVQANGARTLKYGAALKRVSAKSSDFAFVYRSIGDPLVWVQGRVKRTLYAKLIMPPVDGIAAVSSASLDGLKQLYDLADKTVAQIPRGIDRQRIAPRRDRATVRAALGDSESTPVVVFVGSLTPEKRPDRLARVFAGVVKQLPEARLWVVGDGPLRAEFEQLVDDLGITGSVSLIGTSDEVGSFLGAADVLALTSDTEGLPGVILEAACLGVPAVATDVGGVSDAVTTGKTGILVDPDDEAAFTTQLSQLLADRTTSVGLGSTASARFRTTFAITPVGEAYAQLYEAAVQA